MSAITTKLNGWSKVGAIVMSILLSMFIWAKSYGELEVKVERNCQDIQQINEKLDRILERLPAK